MSRKRNRDNTKPSTDRVTQDEHVIMLFHAEHKAWHKLFRDRSIREIIKVLQRIEKGCTTTPRKKHRLKKEGLTKHHLTPKSRRSRDRNVLMLYWEHHEAWHLLFGDLSIHEIIKVLHDIEKN
ncbi:MAG: hypothetical protein Q7R99_03460 [bacterium]|nr:hypothetical protein [bacterium]